MRWGFHSPPCPTLLTAVELLVVGASRRSRDPEVRVEVLDHVGPPHRRVVLVELPSQGHRARPLDVHDLDRRSRRCRRSLDRNLLSLGLLNLVRGLLLDDQLGRPAVLDLNRVGRNRHAPLRRIRHAARATVDHRDHVVNRLRLGARHKTHDRLRRTLLLRELRHCLHLTGCLGVALSTVDILVGLFCLFNSPVSRLPCPPRRSSRPETCGAQSTRTFYEGPAPNSSGHRARGASRSPAGPPRGPLPQPASDRSATVCSLSSPSCLPRSSHHEDIIGGLNILFN